MTRLPQTFPPPGAPPAAGPASQAVQRTCSGCGNSLRVQPAFKDAPMACPRCGLPMGPPGKAQPPGKRAQWTDSAGWVVSFLLHTALLLSLTGISWFSGVGSGAGPGEKSVGLVNEPGQSAIEAATGQVQITSTSVQVTAPAIAEPAKVDVPDVGAGPGATPSETEVLIAVDLGGGGGAAAAPGDFNAYAALGGGTVGGGASFFGLEARGGKFVFVLDRSASMSDVVGATMKLDAAKNELMRSVKALKSGSKFYIVFYNHFHEAMPAKSLEPASEVNKKTYLAWVEKVAPDGNTDPTAAMELALSLKPDAVWLLSDGLFDDSAADAIKSANPGRKIQIHTIAFYENAGEAILKRIAEENRGKYRFVPPPGGAPGRGRP